MKYTFIQKLNTTRGAENVKLQNYNKFYFSLLRKGLLDEAMSNHWTVWHSTVRTLDSWTLSWPAIGQLDTQLTSYWTVAPITIRSLESWTLDWPAIGQLDTALTNHWTVRHSTVQPFAQIIVKKSDNRTYFAYSPNQNCQREDNLSDRSSHFLHPWEGLLPMSYPGIWTLALFVALT